MKREAIFENVKQLQSQRKCFNLFFPLKDSIHPQINSIPTPPLSYLRKRCRHAKEGTKRIINHNDNLAKM